MTPQKPDDLGRFVRQSLVRPAIEVDCSTWNTAEPGEQWTMGRFVKQALTRPAVEVDCTGWPECRPSPLSLTLYSEPAVDAVQLAFGLLDMLTAVNKLDCALGGTGLTKLSGQQRNGAVTLILTAEQPAGAADRLQQICERINQATPLTADVPLPAGVRTIKARVA